MMARYYVWSVGVLSVLFGWVWMSERSVAELANRPLSSLIKDSTDIITGRIVSTSIDDNGSGVARIRVLSSYKGESNESIELHWSTEVEAQRLTEAGSEWVMFLKRDANGMYEPAQFGRSYMRVSFDIDTQENVILLIERMSHVILDMPIKVGRTRTLCEGRRVGDRWNYVDSIAIRDLVQLVRQISGKK